LSRCDSKLRIISSKDSPVGVPEGVNRQSHSEQPKPRKRCCSIHTSFRLIAGHPTGAKLHRLSGILHTPKKSLIVGNPISALTCAELIKSAFWFRKSGAVGIAQYQ
jgi:hypothetical protein